MGDAKRLREKRIRDNAQLFARCCGLIKVKYNKKIARDIDAYKRPSLQSTPSKRKANNEQSVQASKKSKRHDTSSKCSSAFSSRY